MAPWFSMPSPRELARAAAIDDLKLTLLAARCAARLLRLTSARRPREAGLVDAIVAALDRAAAAVRRLG